VFVAPATEEVQGWRCSWGLAAGILPLVSDVDLHPASGRGDLFSHRHGTCCCFFVGGRFFLRTRMVFFNGFAKSQSPEILLNLSHVPGRWMITSRSVLLSVWFLCIEWFRACTMLVWTAGCTLFGLRVVLWALPFFIPAMFILCIFCLFK
jgi:hypothetical protein